MNKLKVGDLIFVKDGSILSRAIRLVSTGRFLQDVPHHVAVVEAIEDNGATLIDANWFKGVRRVDLSVYNNATLWFMRLKEPRDIEKGIEFLQNQIGLGYDRLALLGIFGRAFYRLFGKRIYTKVKFMRNLLEVRTKFFCSEIVSIYGTETGKTLWRAHPSVTTPFDLWRSPLLFDV